MSESFVHWDEDEPPVIPTSCAKCHSTYGYLDFLGEDGTAARVVDREARTGSAIYCYACHNTAAHEMTRVTFPSGAEVAELGPEAVCMQCHQGRQSTLSVREAIAGLPEDEVSEALGFINVHYAVGAATKMGADVQGAYQYEDRSYAGFFEHTDTLRACYECHDAHSLALTPDECSPCHVNVVDYGDLWDIRTGELDFDGDGDANEGIYYEIETLHRQLYAAIQTYAATVIETPLVYAPDAFPYFMVDIDGDGEVDADEISFGNRYASWTPRLVRTVYNYHYIQKDPGAFAHNPGYILQILYDSLWDLSQVVSIDMDGLIRPTPSNASQ
ncbi:MAG: polyheme membrane-associated cytochrome C [Anaerolineae bacterium]|nr:polyheme membrane-associated cytochrome C [Anaerolineae bacterium]